MKKRLLLLVSVSMLAAASSAFATHDHGSRGSMEHGDSPGTKGAQGEKEGEALLASCAQQVASLQRRINRLQADMAGRSLGNSVRDELKKLEQKLKEANEIARPLQLF